MEMTEWKPIETAPKNGTPILLYSPDAREPKIFICAYIQFEGEETGAWFDEWKEDGCHEIDDIEFTHWMALPGPPAEKVN
jgi:hypothetical protein